MLGVFEERREGVEDGGTIRDETTVKVEKFSEFALRGGLWELSNGPHLLFQGVDTCAVHTVA